VATKLGCEAAIHTTRTFVNNDQNRGKVLLKLDFKNAFNSAERDYILKEVQCHISLLYPEPSATRRHDNFAGVHTLLRILLSSNSAVLINIITGVSPPVMFMLLQK
jgi:hypothetical protein